jgi:hypothetical protein
MGIKISAKQFWRNGRCAARKYLREGKNVLKKGAAGAIWRKYE